MIDFILSINPVLIIVFTPWILAQAIKFIVGAVEGKVDFYNFITTGGMPSGHSTAVCALATGIGLSSGFSSSSFAIAVVIATIVMHDAVVIRGAQGKQAQILNKMIDKFINQKEFNYYHLIGHKPIEVVAGAILGISSAFGIWFLFYV